VGKACIILLLPTHHGKALATLARELSFCKSEKKRLASNKVSTGLLWIHVLWQSHSCSAASQSLGLPVWPYAKSVQLKPSIAFLDVQMSSKHAATTSRRRAQHPNTGQLHTKCSIGSTACRSQCLRKSHSASLLLGLQTSTSVDGKFRDTANLC